MIDRPTRERRLAFSPSWSLALAASLALASCQSAYYATMEKFGWEKRDLLVERVEEGRESQREAKERFQSALAAFKSVTGFEGGELEAVYDDLSGEYEAAAGSVEEVRDRIRAIERVAKDLFAEWKKEIAEISSADLRAKSESMRTDTMRRYDELLAAMKAAESKMEPVLREFKDRVLFLKHNLNAQAIASLRTEVSEIDGKVAELVKEMERSISEADAFLAAMESPG